MQVLIVDDNTEKAKTLRSMLETSGHITKVHTAVQPYLIRSLLAIELIDIVFIRLHLWNHASFDGVKNMPVVIFISGSGKDKLTDQPGTRVPYKIKEPYAQRDIQSLLKSLFTERIIEEPSYFFVKHERRCHRIFFDHIEMVERVQSGYVKIWTRDTMFHIAGSLNQFMAGAPMGQFLRVSDQLVLPMSIGRTLAEPVYTFRGRVIPLTFNMASEARKELEEKESWIDWTSK